MEGFVFGIYRSQTSLSAMTVPSTIRVNPGNANVQLGIACIKTMVCELRFNICGLEDSRLANADIQDLRFPNQKSTFPTACNIVLFIGQTIFVLLPTIMIWRVWDILEGFFEGLCPLFWMEVLSILGMVPMGAPIIQRVISWAKVSLPPTCILSNSD
jgi:hypothetical protein